MGPLSTDRPTYYNASDNEHLGDRKSFTRQLGNTV
jgi:hypothetical protein